MKNQSLIVFKTYILFNSYIVILQFTQSNGPNIFHTNKASKEEMCFMFGVPRHIKRDYHKYKMLESLSQRTLVWEGSFEATFSIKSLEIKDLV